jgi:O-6-methylguanine DNA methyltransferase
MPVWTSFQVDCGLRVLVAARPAGLCRIALLENDATLGEEWVGGFASGDEWRRDPGDALLAEGVRQLTAYFRGVRREFGVPVQVSGTPFQLRVWRALLSIPYGETRSYTWLAAEAGNPRAVRAAGSANSRNPLAIVIPCHRVIGADGALRGYAGGVGIKRLLLDLETRAGCA